MRLLGKTAVITGAASGIGRATAILFAREGAMVVVSDINTTTGEELAAEIKRDGGAAIFVRTDVTKSQDVAELMEASEKAYGKIDILFNNAGISHQCPVTELEEADWDKVLNTNLKSVFLGCKYVLPKMQKNGGGAIINCASILGHVGFPETPAYNASKGGVVMLTKNVAIDYAAYNIRVNAVCPGYVITPLILGQVAGADNPEEITRKVTAQHVMGRLGLPEEIAPAVLFLASDDSRFITGSALMVDGGFTAW